MCKEIIQFCSGSTKPLVFVGSSLLWLLSVAIGYTAYTSHSLSKDLGPVAICENFALIYFILQLAGCAFLVVVAAFGFYAAYYDDKSSIRALSVITTTSFILSLVAIVLIGFYVPNVEESLKNAQSKYDFTKNFTDTTDPNANHLVAMSLSQTNDTKQPKDDWDSTQATPAWDSLQGRGCCGFTNSTEWSKFSKQLPKSCCANATKTAEGKFICSNVDDDHKRPCADIIKSTLATNPTIVLALIALISLYLANVTGISAYEHFHYNEASQNAYS